MDKTVEFIEVDIALERVLEGRVMRFVDDDVVEYPLVQLLMCPGRGKVHVSRNMLAGLYQAL